MKIHFAWDANPEPNIAGYRIHAGRASGNYNDAAFPAGKDVGNVLTETYDVSAFGVWYFSLVAYDSSEVTSGFASEIQVTINPPVAFLRG